MCISKQQYTSIHINSSFLRRPATTRPVGASCAARSKSRRLAPPGRTFCGVWTNQIGFVNGSMFIMVNIWLMMVYNGL